jgi:hypothetical protein
LLNYDIKFIKDLNIYSILRLIISLTIYKKENTKIWKRKNFNKLKKISFVKIAVTSLKEVVIPTIALIVFGASM